MNAHRFSWVSIGLAVVLAAGLLGWNVLREPALGRIEGRVMLPDGKPLARARVTVEGENFWRTVRTDAQGRFVHKRVPAGKIVVTAGGSWHEAKARKVVLGEAETVSLKISAKRNQPALRVTPYRRTVFSSQGVPRIPVSGYAVGNDVELTIWRLDPRVVVGSSTGLADLMRMNDNPDEYAAAPPRGLVLPATPTRTATVPFGTPDREGYVQARIAVPVPTGAKGLWMVRASHAGATVHAWVLVTDVAIVVKQPTEGAPVLAYAVDITQGTAVPGTTVTRYRNGRLDADDALTDRDGLAWLAPCRAKSGEREIFVGIRGDDAAFLGMDNWSDPEPGQRMVVDLQTDRPLYRPGHRIFYKGTVRERPDPADPYRYSVPAPRAVDVVMRDAMGAEIGKARLRSSPTGTFHGSFDTSTEGPTGGYSLEAVVDGKSQSAYVPVVTYRKPDFEIDVEAAKKSFLEGESAPVNVVGRYYHGAPAAGAKVEWQAYSEPDWSVDSTVAEDDEFGRESSPWETSTYYGGRLGSGEAVLDAQGRWSAQIPTVEEPSDTLEVPWVSPAQARRVTVVVTVTDVSGRTVAEEARFTVTTSPWLVALDPDGTLAEPGKPTAVDAVVRDTEGKPVAGAPVKLEAWRVTRSPVEYDDDDPDTYDGYREKRIRVGSVQEAVSGADGRARMNVVPQASGVIECRATVRGPGGRVSQTTTFLFAAGDRDPDVDIFTNDLTLATDQRHYSAGETARILVGSRQKGQTVLLTVEADRIHRVLTVPIRSASTIVKLPLPESYGPNITVSACQVHRQQFSENSTVVRVKIPERALKVEVAPLRSEAKPGETVPCRVRIHDSKGRPVQAEFSLAVVDEALLSLRDYDSRDMVRTFFPQRWSSVRTANSFTNDLLGGDDKGAPAITPRQRFLDTAFWKADVLTGVDGTAVVSVPLPDNLTRWRYTVRATGLSRLMVGYGSGRVTVSKPLSLRLETPRVLGVGDRGRVLAVVSNQTGADQTVSVRLPVAGLFGGGDPVQTVRVASGATATVEWPVAPSAPADLVMQATAWTADRRHTDGVLARLPVRPFGRVLAGSASGVMEGPEHVVDVPLVAEDLPGSRSMVVRVTPGVGAPLASAVDMLMDYPYGCTEQTLSRIVPLAKVNALDPSLLRPEQRKRIRQLVVDGVSRLRRFQHPSGGWGWWEYGDDDPFLTAYVLHGLLDLQAAGVEVPRSVVFSARDALLAMEKQGGKAGIWGVWAAFRAKAPGLGRPRIPKSPSVRDLAAAILWEHERGGNVDALVVQLRGRRKVDGELVWWSDRKKGEWVPDRSDRMDTALAVRALIASNPNDPDARRGLRWLLSERDGDGFGDTRDTAFVADALCAWIRTHVGSRAEPESLVVAVNGTQVALEGVSGERLARVPARLLKPGDNRLRIAVNGVDPQSVFWSVSFRQTLPLSPRRGLDPVVADGVTLGREYLVDDRVREQFRVGDNIVVRLTIETPVPLHHVLLEDPFPAGLEATERGTAQVETGGMEWTEPWENVDVRDDRIALFFRRIEPGKHVYTVHLRAQSPGRYAVVPASLVPMYRPGMRIESRSASLEIAP